MHKVVVNSGATQWMLLSNFRGNILLTFWNKSVKEM